MPQLPPQPAFWTASDLKSFSDSIALASFWNPFPEKELSNAKELHRFVHSISDRYDHLALMAGIAIPNLNRTEYKRALGHTRSRAFYDGGHDHVAFVPIGDLINHAEYSEGSKLHHDTVNAFYYYNNISQSYNFYALRNISDGEQVNSYYAESVANACSANFLSTYGFLPFGCNSRLETRRNTLDEEDEADDDDDNDDHNVVDKSQQASAVHSAALVGRRVSVFWPEQKAWYDGIIAKFNERQDNYLIRYDNGEVHFEELSRIHNQQEWRLLDTETRRLPRLPQVKEMTSTQAKQLIGVKIMVHSPSLKAWFEGTVGKYNDKTGLHYVHYDDGEIHEEHLSSNGQATKTTGRWRLANATMA